MDQFEAIQRVSEIKYDFNLSRKERDEIIYTISPGSLLEMIIDLCDCPETYQIVTMNKRLKFILPQIEDQKEKDYFCALVQTAVRERLNVPERKEHKEQIIANYKTKEI